MYVPNYIPDPLEVPGNVTEEPYGARLAFVRYVGALHLGSLVLIAAMAWLPLPALGVMPVLGIFGGLLVGLELMRIRMRGRPREARFSGGMMPIILGIGAWVVREMHFAGFPVWALLAGPAAAGIYGALCGRDFSFVGCWALALVFSTVGIAAGAVFLRLPPETAALALAGNVAYLSYLVYDLASLLSRRRLGEGLAAVVDLYRDVLNVFGYIPRVLAHWRQHRIWR